MATIRAKASSTSENLQEVGAKPSLNVETQKLTHNRKEPTFVVRRILSGRRLLRDATILVVTKSFPVFNFVLLRILLCVSVSVQLGTSVAWAAKTPTAPDLSDAKHPDVPPTDAELERAKIVNITPAPPVNRELSEPNAYYYKFRNSISFRAGAEWALSDLEKPGLGFGVLYAYPLGDLRGVEAGADVSRDGNGTLHFARRNVIGNERLRWFYKYGAGVRIVGSDQLVTFLRLRNWQARFGGGFELTTSDPMSIRVDVESMFATESVKALATLGIVFAF